MKLRSAGDFRQLVFWLTLLIAVGGIVAMCETMLASLGYALAVHQHLHHVVSASPTP